MGLLIRQALTLTLSRRERLSAKSLRDQNAVTVSMAGKNLFQDTAASISSNKSNSITEEALKILPKNKRWS